MKGGILMKKRLGTYCSIGILSLALLAIPNTGQAQQQTAGEGDGAFFLGSVLFSIIHVPYKLITCAATQASATAFYVGTFDVPGHYEEGTNGKDIGETARRSCTGAWLVTPSQVKSDYGS